MELFQKRLKNKVKELPMAKTEIILSNKINNTVFNYNPEYKINIHEFHTDINK